MVHGNVVIFYVFPNVNNDMYVTNSVLGAVSFTLNMILLDSNKFHYKNIKWCDWCGVYDLKIPISIWHF
jgi:hypothetical protein